MNSVPLFPEFRKLTLDDRDWYEAFFKPFPNYADFTFNNLVVWQDQHDDLSISRIDNILIFQCTSLYMDDQLMINFIGDGDYDSVLHELFAYLRERQQESVILGVPEFIVQSLQNPHHFSIEEDRDNAEYVLDTWLLGTLDGPAMRRIRQMVHGYERDYTSITVKELDLHDEQARDFLRNELLGWKQAFTTNETAGQEKGVILRTLDVADTLEYGNVSLFIDDKLVGFALYRHIPSHEAEQTVVVNHLKTSYGYPHTSYYLSHRLADVLHKKGYSYMNYEQDLGIEGLRYFKEKLKPVELLKKFNIAPAQAA